MIRRYVPLSGTWTSSLGNVCTMAQVFSVTTCWAWDSRHGGKLRLVRLWLSILGMHPVADKTIVYYYDILTQRPIAGL